VTEVATQAMYVRFGCRHFMYLQNGDQLHHACPACYPPKGVEPWKLCKVPASRFSKEES
jgi:hypothetical protein